jgi:hypothetical protein
MRRETKRRNVMLGWYHSVLEIAIPTLEKSDSKRGKKYVEENHYELE